jgi:hypothetical protein
MEIKKRISKPMKRTFRKFSILLQLNFDFVKKKTKKKCLNCIKNRRKMHIFRKPIQKEFNSATAIY